MQYPELAQQYRAQIIHPVRHRRSAWCGRESSRGLFRPDTDPYLATDRATHQAPGQATFSP